MSGKYPKTFPQHFNPKINAKIKGKSDTYNLEKLYPKTPRLAKYDDHDVIDLAKKILNPKNIKLITPEFPDGVMLDYTDDPADQNDVKQIDSNENPIPGEGYAPLPHIKNGSPINDTVPRKPTATDFDNLPNVKISSEQAAIDVTDILVPGTSAKAN